jgi:ribonuclease VapC
MTEDGCPHDRRSWPVAILLREPGSQALVDAILDAPSAKMSAGSALELQVVASRRGGDAGRVAALTILDDLSIDITAVTAQQALDAGAAHSRFGRGSGSKARLNFGDCFAYALAAESDEPLLFVGDDFTHTDLTPVSLAHGCRGIRPSPGDGGIPRPGQGSGAGSSEAEGVGSLSG